MTLLILIVCFVFGALKVDHGAQGHRPLPLGWFTVSKVPKIIEIYFNYSTKKKRFEKRPNVCKWLKTCFKYFSVSFNDRFKPTLSSLTATINLQQPQQQQQKHAQHHVGLSNGNNQLHDCLYGLNNNGVFHCNKSGDINPIKIKTEGMLFNQLIVNLSISLFYKVKSSVNMLFRHTRKKFEALLDLNCLNQHHSLYSCLHDTNPIMFSGLRTTETWCWVVIGWWFKLVGYTKEGLEVVLVLSRKLIRMIDVRAWVLCGVLWGRLVQVIGVGLGFCVRFCVRN